MCLVGGWGGLGWSEPAPIADWMEMRRVGLAPEGNILLRCRFHSSLKIWRTEPLQPRQCLPSPSPSSPSVVLATPLAAPHSRVRKFLSLPFLSLSPRRSHTLAGAPPPHPSPATGSRRHQRRGHGRRAERPRQRRAAGRARELLPRAGRAAPAREQPRLGGAELTAAGRRDSARPPRLLRRTSLLPPCRVP